MRWFIKDTVDGILREHAGSARAFITPLACFFNRQFTCDETGLKRSASYPLIHSDSLQLATTEGKAPPGEWFRAISRFPPPIISRHLLSGLMLTLFFVLQGPETLHAEDTLSLCPANRKVCKDDWAQGENTIVVVSQQQSVTCFPLNVFPAEETP